MFKITMNKVYLTRGDTARFSISLVNLPGVNQEYKLTDEDDIYFILTDTPRIVSIEELSREDSCIFYKKGIEIVLNPEDTINLEEGEYYYQVRVVLRESGDLNTIIEPTEFLLSPKQEVI